MKKLFLISAMVGLGLASCTQDEITSVNTSDAISFNVVASRSDVALTSNLDSIYVIGVKEDGSRYMDNVKYRKKNGVFLPDSLYMWPTDSPLKFYVSNISFDDPRVGDNIDDDTPYATYYTDSLPAMPDLLTATAEGDKTTATSAGISVTLKHRMAQIVIRAKSSNTDLTFQIYGVYINGQNQAPKFFYNDETWAPADNTTIAYYGPKSLSNAVTLNGTPQSLLSYGQAFMPAITRAGWNPKTDPTNINKRSYLSLALRITETVGGKQVYPDTDDKTSDTTLNTASIPLPVEWQAGKKYVYTLDFTDGAGYVNPRKPTPENPDEDPFEAGDLILGGELQFIVEEVTGWSDATQDDGFVDMDGGEQDEYDQYPHTGPEEDFEDDGVNNAYILYMKDGHLDLGKWGRDITSTSDMVFTKFGGVVGFTLNGTWNNSTSLLFNPTTTASYTYALVPVYAEDYLTVTDVSAAGYHNEANLALGKGDICKLAGLSSAQAQYMIANGTIDSYNSGWRLPTNAENESFVNGTQANTAWVAGDATPANPGIKSFTANAHYVPDTNPVDLPAAGNRSNTGAADDQGSDGYYWSSTPASATNGQFLNFTASNVNPSLSDAFASGRAVRCVRP
jgi:uncharacterized protein (TIGR02145 family)